MTREQRLRELVENWRAEYHALCGQGYAVRERVMKCADELEAALAAPPDAQGGAPIAAPQEVPECPECAPCYMTHHALGIECAICGTGRSPGKGDDK